VTKPSTAKQAVTQCCGNRRHGDDFDLAGHRRHVEGSAGRESGIRVLEDEFVTNNSETHHK